MEHLNIKTPVHKAVLAARYALHQLGCTGFSDLGEKYGEEMGGHNVHPASIQYHETPELTVNFGFIPPNLHLRTPPELGWDRTDPPEAA